MKIKFTDFSRAWPVKIAAVDRLSKFNNKIELV